ncbi:hypothetical protein J6S37_01615 [Candidatus Saccharibacteria bacterium]|nr:hypothetical protein [Candidatus Saccharibacteria bacterium]
MENERTLQIEIHYKPVEPTDVGIGIFEEKSQAALESMSDLVRFIDEFADAVEGSIIGGEKC